MPVSVAEEDHPDTETQDVITVDSATRHAVLKTETILRGIEATNYRNWLESVTAEDLSSRWFNYIGRFYKRLDEISPPVVEDDLMANRLVIRAQYTLSRFFEGAAGTEESISVHAYGLRSLIDPPQTRRRRWPYALTADRFVRHRIEVSLPFAAGVEQQPQVIQGNGLEYRVEKGLSGQQFTAVHELKFTEDFVPAERMGDFCDVVDEVLQSLSTSVRPSSTASHSAELTTDHPQARATRQPVELASLEKR